MGYRKCGQRRRVLRSRGKARSYMGGEKRGKGLKKKKKKKL